MTRYIEEPKYYFLGVIEFLVFSIAFVISCSLISVGSGEGMLKQALIYSCTVSVSMALARYLLASIKRPHKTVLLLMLRNILGLLVAFAVMLIVHIFLDFNIMNITEILLASVISFFVLGTVIPLLNSDRTKSI